MGKEDKRQENQDKEGYNSSRKMLDPRSGKSQKFYNETRGHSAECIVGTKLFFSCSNADF